jgi:hypothetical protein
MGADGNSQLETMWDAVTAAIATGFNAYGRIVPAILVTLLYLSLIGLFCWWLEDIPFELPVFEGVGGIFRSIRTSWHKGTSDRTLTR